MPDIWLRFAWDMQKIYQMDLTFFWDVLEIILVVLRYALDCISLLEVCLRLVWDMWYAKWSWFFAWDMFEINMRRPETFTRHAWYVYEAFSQTNMWTAPNNPMLISKYLCNKYLTFLTLIDIVQFFFLFNFKREGLFFDWIFGLLVILSHSWVLV